MYNSKQIQFLGKHDYERSNLENHNTFTINIFKWEMKSSSKTDMKKSTGVVKVIGQGKNLEKVEKAYQEADRIVKELDGGTYSGKKRFIVKY